MENAEQKSDERITFQISRFDKPTYKINVSDLPSTEA